MLGLTAASASIRVVYHLSESEAGLSLIPCGGFDGGAAIRQAGPWREQAISGVASWERRAPALGDARLRFTALRYGVLTLRRCSRWAVDGISITRVALKMWRA